MSIAVVIDPAHRRWTAADLRDLPEDRNRYEIIDGELFVTPAPSLWHPELPALTVELPALFAAALGD